MEGDQTIASPIEKWTWSPSARVRRTGRRGSMRTGALEPTKKSPRVKLRVIAAASSSVSGRGRLFGRKVEVEALVLGAAEKVLL